MVKITPRYCNTKLFQYDCRLHLFKKKSVLTYFVQEAFSESLFAISQSITLAISRETEFCRFFQSIGTLY